MPWVGQPMQWDGPITVMVPTQKLCIVHVCHVIYICYYNESVFKYLYSIQNKGKRDRTGTWYGAVLVSKCYIKFVSKLTV